MADEKPKLTYEETPIIDPKTGSVAESAPSVASDVSSVIPEASRIFHPPGISQGPHEVMPQQPTMPSMPKEKKKGHIGTILFIVLLFGLGVWLSSQLRSFFAPAPTEEVAVPTSAPAESTASASVREASPSGASLTGWVTYEVISGATKKPIAGVTYQLPDQVKAPGCDSSSCASSGTNLPGGTRFTVAARGKGQLLPDFRGAILTDATGKEFVMKQSVIGSYYIYEYTGDFTGRTGGGYTFTAIRGVLVPVSETLAVEFNHFAPTGISTDFSKDDALFNEIIATFAVAGGPVASPTARPVVSTPTSTPIATSSGN